MAEAERKKVYLIDAMGYIFRAYYAPMERLRSPSGLPTKVPYLFSNMVRKLIREHAPDYIAVAWDTAAPTFRDKLFAEYKAQGPPMPEDLPPQLPFVRRFCEAMGLPILEMPGYEADDIIGALAEQAAGQGLDVVVVTSDKDMLQLVRPGGKKSGAVRVLNPSKGDLVVDEKKVEELLGVPPEKVADVMALMGDSIDNIPGAKGIGEKGARELIQRFGSVEAALEHAAEVESKRYREALQNQREQVLMSKKLATIASDAPVKLEPEALRLREPDAEALRELYTELGFSRLLRELAESSPAAAGAKAETKIETKAFGTAGELREFLEKLPKGQAVALWFELAAGEREVEGFGSRAAAMEISPAAGVGRTAWLDAEGEFLRALLPWARDAARPKIVHDPKLAELLLGAEGGGEETNLAGVVHATRLYSYLLRPTTSKHDLMDVVLRQSNLAAPQGGIGERAEVLQRLAPELRRQVDEAGLGTLYEKIDLPLAPVLARMERHGVRIDPIALQEMSVTLSEEMRGLESKIWKLAGVEFNIDSPKQLAEILFDKLALPIPRVRGRGATKARSTAAGVLEELAAKHELPKQVLEYRELSKLKSTYVDALPELINAQTGRLHTSLSQTGTATGRLASSEPNLQNIPIRTELGRRIRAAFVASPGHVLLAADYSQIELRILAHFSRDSVLTEAFLRGEDIHARTAQEVFGVAPFAQTAEHRRAAKAINFGIVYGVSAFGLSQQLGVGQKEAAKFIAAYFERYKGIKEYLDRSLGEARKNGFTRTLFGRTRPIPELQSDQPAMRGFGERQAMNTPLQGTAADLIKLAMIEIDRRLRAEGFRAKMILQVHDDLLFEAPVEELERLKGMVKTVMEAAPTYFGPVPAYGEAGALLAKAYSLPFAVPLAVDMKAGGNWRDLS